MKQIFLLLSITFLTVNSFSQERLEVKIFLSRNDYVENKSSANNELEIIKRTGSDIVMVVGNDYKIDSPTLKKKYFKAEIWAIDCGDSLFINCSRIGLCTWYAKALTTGRYLCFEACPPCLIQLQKDLGLYNPLGSGGAIGGAANAKTRILYLYDSELDLVKYLDGESVREVLTTSPKLLQKFNAESKKNSKVFLKYIALANANSG